MDKRKILLVLSIMSVTMPLSANWLEKIKERMKFSNRELVIAGATAGILTIGSHIFYRLGNGFKNYKSKQLIKKKVVEYSSLKQEYAWLDSINDISANGLTNFMGKNTFKVFAKNLQNDIASLKAMREELETVNIDQADNRPIKKDAKRLRISIEQLIEQLEKLAIFINLNEGYWTLEKTYSEVYPKFKQELILGPKAMISQIVALAKSNDLSAAKDYPIAYYANALINDLGRLSIAIQEFEKSQGKDQATIFYKKALELEAILIHIKKCLLSLPEYESQVISYNEVKRQEALILEERRKADAAERQAHAQYSAGYNAAQRDCENQRMIQCIISGKPYLPYI